MTQSPQRTHSALLGVHEGSISALHARAHALHCVQAEGSKRMPNTEMRLKKPYIAPSGQRKRQNGRHMNTDATTTPISISIFHENSQPTLLCSDAFSATSGTPASSVPAGHMFCGAGVAIPV